MILEQYVKNDLEKQQNTIQTLKKREKKRCKGWKFDKSWRKIVCDNQVGINWYWYQRHILILKLIYFAPNSQTYNFEKWLQKMKHKILSPNSKLCFILSCVF